MTLFVLVWATWKEKRNQRLNGGLLEDVDV